MTIGSMKTTRVSVCRSTGGPASRSFNGWSFTVVEILLTTTLYVLLGLFCCAIQVVWCGVPPPTPGTLAAAAFPINLTAIQQEHHVYHQARFSMLRRRSFGGLRNDVVDRAARVVNYRPVVSMGRHYRSQDGPCDRDPMEVLFENRAARHVRLQQSIQSKENFAN